MSAPGFSLADVSQDFASVREKFGERFKSPSEFDAGLRVRASQELVSLLHAVPGLEQQYNWTTIRGAFCSGIEAWLQHEILLSLSLRHAANDPPLVVRVVEADCGRAVQGIKGSHCQFLLVPVSLIDRYVALQQALLEMTVWSGEPYPGDDPWCRTNLIAGSHIEALLRGERLGFAYAAALRFLKGEARYTSSDYLGAPEDWLPRASTIFESEGDTDVEKIVRAPLRFALFHEWGRSLSPFASSRSRGDPWGESAADIEAVRQLLDVQGSIPVHGIPRAEFYGGYSVEIGMAIFIQMQRIALLTEGLSAAVSWICCVTDKRTRPAMVRLSQGELIHRCLNAVQIGMSERSETEQYSLLLSVDEMQVFFAAVAGVLLGRFGGGINLNSLRQVGWQTAREYFEDESRTDARRRDVT